MGSTCETAGHFFLYHVTARWELFLSTIDKDDKSELAKVFPFTQYFESQDPETPLFAEGGDSAAHMEVAWSCWRYIQQKFTELEVKPCQD